MRPTIHPDRAVLFIGADILADRDHRLRLRIFVLPDTEVQRPAENVRGYVDLALVLRQRKTRRIPGQPPGACTFRNRHAVVFTDGRITRALLVRERRPSAAEVSSRRTVERPRKLSGPRCPQAGGQQQHRCELKSSAQLPPCHKQWATASALCLRLR